MADNNTCEVTFSNGTKKQIPRPFVLKSLLSEEDFLVSVKDKENSNTHPAKCSPVVAARVNNYVMNLNQTIQFKKVSVEPVYEFSSLGNEVVRHTTLYMLSMALAKLYPEKYFTAEHHLGFGYLCESHDIVLTEQTVQEIQDYMKELAQQDLPIVETHISHTEAVEYFKSINRPYTVSLLKSLNDPTIWVDVCGGYMDIHTRILGPSSSLITGKFSVKFRDETSFVLNFQPDPYLLSYVYDDGEIAKVYKEANSWGKQACLECVGDINKYIREKKVKELILRNHALHDRKISSIAFSIFQRKSKLVLIAGPSASGKTTFSKKLGIQLEILGFEPVIFSVDDYYKPRAETPLNEFGAPDFERMDALRVDLLNEHLSALMRGEVVQCPIYDFKQGRPSDKVRILTLPKRAPIVIMEGIHCLNPKLTPSVTENTKFKIFIAPLMQLNVSEFNFISSTRTRLLRRIVRDYQTRGHSVEATLAMWSTVRVGEHKYIFPFINSADSILDTSLDYEFSAVKIIAQPLLAAVPPSSQYYNAARELLVFLWLFDSILHNDIPSDSLIREFIGGSFFETV